ncbi:SWIM zinc finger family protein [Herpetosiphon llansteffanensis]|uniref:SWIM zinc finger family protein n=1 Tax=Herpetosiphon llansteffanensis TaxID=2094568 RepID=UPI000D7C1DDA|nr:SWIM zinc finger family protein [Herpetosiphon llansteffanensis]
MHTVIQTAMRTHFGQLAAAITMAAPIPALHTSAALLLARCDEIVPSSCAPTSITATALKPIPPSSPLATLLQSKTTADDRWCFRVQQALLIAGDCSRRQLYEAVVLVLSQQVTRSDATTFTVQGSKAYTVTLANGIDHIEGFTCQCRGFWSHGGGQLCKHVLAAALIALDPEEGGC